MIKFSVIAFLFVPVLLLMTGCPEDPPPDPNSTIVGPPTRPNDGSWTEGNDYTTDVWRGSTIPDRGTTTSDRGIEDVDTINPSDIALEPRDPALTDVMLQSGNGQSAFQSVYFGFDEFSIRATERAKLETVAAYLRNNVGSKVVAEGHTSWRGTEEYNLGLGDRRANAVKNYLINLGVSSIRIDVLSKGELDATTEVDKTDPRAIEDRRVDIFLIQ